jgi:hypothetical protein
MVATLYMDTEQDNISRYVLNPKESIGIVNKGLEDFICVSSMQFFKRFKINTDFHTTDPSKWNDDEHFKKSTAIVTNINVVIVVLYNSYNLPAISVTARMNCRATSSRAAVP